jgi:hypothetical protein
MDIKSLVNDNVQAIMASTDITGHIMGCPGIQGHTNSLARSFTDMMNDLAHGDATSVIRYINRGSIRTDVEAILGRRLDSSEAIDAGRLAPCHIDHLLLSRACARARELQALRATGRRTCQMYQGSGVGSVEFHARLNSFLGEALNLVNVGNDGDYEDGDYD